jgi:hypothetical protein
VKNHKSKTAKNGQNGDHKSKTAKNGQNGDHVMGEPLASCSPPDCTVSCSPPRDSAETASTFRSQSSTAHEPLVSATRRPCTCLQENCDICVEGPCSDDRVFSLWYQSHFWNRDFDFVYYFTAPSWN